MINKTYRLTFDLHTHTTFSHGKGSIEDNVKEALKKGLKTIGISDHGPGHVTYGLSRREFPVMRQEVERLRALYPQIEILLGVEANIMNASGHLDVTPGEFLLYDYILAGYHYGVFGENPFRAGLLHGANLLGETTGFRLGFAKKWNTDMTVRAIYENSIRVLTHPGDKGELDLDAVLTACEKRGTLLEISNHHKNLTVEDIKRCARFDVSFILSSDAHLPQNVGTFDQALQRALEAGLDLCRIVNLEVEEK